MPGNLGLSAPSERLLPSDVLIVVRRGLLLVVFLTLHLSNQFSGLPIFANFSAGTPVGFGVVDVELPGSWPPFERVPNDLGSALLDWKMDVGCSRVSICLILAGLSANRIASRTLAILRRENCL